MRLKAEQVEVSDPDKAWTQFQSALRKLVQVPKAEIETKRKRVKRKVAKKKRKA